MIPTDDVESLQVMYSSTIHCLGLCSAITDYYKNLYNDADIKTDGD